MRGKGGLERFRTGVLIAFGFVAVALTAATPAQADWQLPATDLLADAGIYQYQDVTVGPDGAITVVWLTEEDYSAGGTQRLMVSTRPPGSSLFGPAQQLDDPASYVGVQVATAPNGDTTAMWLQQKPQGEYSYSVKVATRPAGSNSFGPPEILATADPNDPPEVEVFDKLDAPDLAIGPDGNAEVVWTRTWEVEPSDEEDDRRVWIIQVETASRPSGSQSFQPTQLLDEVSSHLSNVFPHVASGPGSRTTVAWPRDPTSATVLPDPQSGVFTATRPAGSSNYGQPVKIGDYFNSLEPEVEMAADGRTTVVWYGEDLAVEQATRPAGSDSFSSPQALSAPAINPGTLDRSYPELAFDPEGQTTVVWEQSKGTGNTIIQSATRPAGSDTFSQAVDLSTRRAWYPEIAVGPDGATTVVWGTLPESVPVRLKPSMEAASRLAGSNDFGAPVDLSAAYFFGGQVPGVVTAPSGRTTAIWNGQSDPGILGAFLTDRVGGSGQPSLGSPKVTGPSKAKANKRATFQVQVSNVGNAVATGVSIKALGKGASAMKSVGSLNGGQTEKVPVSIKFTKKGKIPVTFTVSSANAGKKSVKKTVKVG